MQGARRLGVSAPLPAAPVQPLMLDEVGGTVICAYSLCRKLRRAYTGYAFRVRRASDDATLDVPFTRWDLTDWRMLEAFCAGTDGFVRIAYDQGGNSDASDTTASHQPKIYDSVTGLVRNGGGKPAASFDGSAQQISASHGLSLGTSPALTTGIAMQVNSLVANGIGACLGSSNGAGGAWFISSIASQAGQVAVSVSGRNRIFSCSSVSNSHAYTVQKAASAVASAFTGSQDTAGALSQVSTVGAGQNLTSGNVIRWGAATTGADPASWCSMYSNLLVLWNEDLSADQQARFYEAMRYHT